MPFAYDGNGFMTNQKCFIITGEHIAFLTAFLNSSLFKFCFRNSFPELQGDTREMSKIFFDKIPVIKVSDDEDKDFQSLVSHIQNAPSIDSAKLIDEKIFGLYGLTIEESNAIGFIEIQ